jgi:integrase
MAHTYPGAEFILIADAFDQACSVLEDCDGLLNRSPFFEETKDAAGRIKLKELVEPEERSKIINNYDDARRRIERLIRDDIADGVLHLYIRAENGQVERLVSREEWRQVWTADDEAAFLKSAPVHLHLPLVLALWTGQRLGDLLRLPWSAYDGTRIRLKQSKTGARVSIPVGAPLKAALDSAAKRGPMILTSSEKRPWTSDGFRASWRKACAKAGIVGVTFNDLRGTAVTRLALAECTEAEIATITGHSLRDVRSILDAHYLHRDPALADRAIAKLERGTKTPN